MAGGRLLWNDVQIPRLSSIDFSTINSTNPGKHLASAIDSFIKLKTNEANADLLRGMIQASNYGTMQEYLNDPNNAEALKNADFSTLQKAFEYKQNQVALDSELQKQAHTTEFDKHGDLAGMAVMAHRTGNSSLMEQVRKLGTERGISGTNMEKLLNRAIADERAKILANDATDLVNTKNRLAFQRYEKARPGIIEYFQALNNGEIERAKKIRNTHPGIAGLNDDQFNQMITYGKDYKLYGDDTSKRINEELRAKDQINTEQHMTTAAKQIQYLEDTEKAYQDGIISAKERNERLTKSPYGDITKLAYDPKKFREYLDDSKKAVQQANKQTETTVTPETTDNQTQSIDTVKPKQDTTNAVIEAIRAGKISMDDIEHIRNDIYDAQNSRLSVFNDYTLAPLYKRLAEAGITKDMLTPELVNSLRNFDMSANTPLTLARAKNMGVTPGQYFVDKYTQNQQRQAQLAQQQALQNQKQNIAPTTASSKVNDRLNKELGVTDNPEQMFNNAFRTTKDMDDYITAANANDQAKLNDLTAGKNSIYGSYANVVNTNLVNGNATNLTMEDITTAVSKIMKDKAFNTLTESDGKSVEISINPKQLAEDIRTVMNQSQCNLAMAIAAVRNNIENNSFGSSIVDIEGAVADARLLGKGRGEEKVVQIINLQNKIKNRTSLGTQAKALITEKRNLDIPFARASDLDRNLNNFNMQLIRKQLQTYM